MSSVYQFKVNRRTFLSCLFTEQDFVAFRLPSILLAAGMGARKRNERQGQGFPLFDSTAEGGAE